MVQYIRAERGCIELLILAQLGHIGVQQMGVIHRMQQIAALPAALLQGKAQLLTNAAGPHGILGKEDRIVGLKCIAQPIGQRVNLGQLYTVCLLPVLGQQIAGGNDLLRLGTVADQCDARTGGRLQQVKALACAGQRSQRGVLPRA